MDLVFVNGLVKSKEKYLIPERVFLQAAETSTADDAYKLITDYSFGGETGGTAADFETAIEREWTSYAEFIKKYSPNKRFSDGIFAKNDFHNAENAVRMKYAGASAAGFMSDGNIDRSVFLSYVGGEKADIPDYLSEPMKKAEELFENSEATGIKVSVIFARAYYAYMFKTVKYKAWRKFLTYEVDAKNLSVALRSADFNAAKEMFIGGGKISEKVLKCVSGGEDDKALGYLRYTEYSELIKQGLDARADNRSLVEFELIADDFAMKKLKEKRFESEGITPLLLYCNYKANEIKNVRIVISGKLGGADKEEIKRRLRECYAG